MGHHGTLSAEGKGKTRGYGVDYIDHSSIVRFDLVNLRLRLLKFLLVYLLVSKDNGLGALRRR